MFQGWTPAITGPMPLEELMGWHAKALARSGSKD
ncbi:GpE family phage tail protein [Hydrogenophaga sp. H7]